jgi:hypothetical protein
VGAQITQGIGQAWAQLTTFVPKLLGFLIILLIGWLIAKAISKAVGFLLDKLGFNRLVERAGLGSMMARSPIDAGGLIVKLVYYFILLIALQFAFGAFGTGNAVSNLLNDIIAYLPRVVVAIVLVIVAAAIAKVARDMISGTLGQRAITPIVGRIVYVAILAFGLIAALDQLGIATTVTMPVLITVLATIGGILIVGLGGGMIRPMQQRWEGWLGRMQQELSAPEGSVPGTRTPDSRTPGSGFTSQPPTGQLAGQSSAGQSSASQSSAGQQPMAQSSVGQSMGQSSTSQTSMGQPGTQSPTDPSGSAGRWPENGTPNR